MGFHMLGSALLWIAVLRLALSMRERPQAALAPARPDEAALAAV